MEQNPLQPIAASLGTELAYWRRRSEEHQRWLTEAKKRYESREDQDTIGPFESNEQVKEHLYGKQSALKMAAFYLGEIREVTR